jgi:hypothetical protein
MSNFGAGQNLFGNNQNKNQGTSLPGSTPAAGTSALGSLGSNTTSGSAFGGPGAGNAPSGGGTASGPTGGIFGTGSSAFGGGGNMNTSTSTPSGAGTGGTGMFGNSSLFAGMHASYSIFMEPPHPKLLRKSCDKYRVYSSSGRGRAVRKYRFEHRYFWRPSRTKPVWQYHRRKCGGRHWRCAPIKRNLVSEIDLLSVDFSISVWFSETCGRWREPSRLGHGCFHWQLIS